MKKIKVVAVVLSAVMAFSLMACGTSTATEPAPQPAAEVKPAPVEVTEPAPEPKEEPMVEAPTEEPATEEVASEEPATEEPTEEPEVDPMEALLASNMGEYVSDGVFDAEKFMKDTGASYWWLGAYDDPVYGNLVFGYEDWFIQLGSDQGNPDINFIMLGDGDWLSESPSRAYSFVFPSGNNITIKDEQTDITVSAECVTYLQDIFSFISENGLDMASDIPGTDFKPCNPEDETEQY